MVIPIRSGSSSTKPPYDPWLDTDDNGQIDMGDIVAVVDAFGAKGDPINKTELLIEVNNTYTELLNTIDSCNASLLDLQGRVAVLESISLPLNDTITKLQSRIDTLNASLLDIVSRTNSLNASVIDIQSRTTSLEGEVAQLQTNVTMLQANITSLNSTVTLLQTTVNTLQTNFAFMNASLTQLQSTVAILNSTFTNQINNLQAEIDTLNATKLGKPDYDSGWWIINQGQQLIFNHNLGTQNVLVYMMGYDWGGTYYMHQIKYGGDSDWPNEYGCRWQDLTSSSITVFRGANDPNWNMVRIMLWKLPT